MIKVKWHTIGGTYYEGILVGTDNGTGIVQLYDGREVTLNFEGFIFGNGQILIDNQTTFLEG